MDEAVLYEMILAANFLDIKALAPPLTLSAPGAVELATCGWSTRSLHRLCTNSHADMLLHMQGLLDLCCKTVADIIKGRVSARLQQMLCSSGAATCCVQVIV